MTWKLSKDEPWSSGAPESHSEWLSHARNELDYLSDRKARDELELKKLKKQYDEKEGSTWL